MSNYIWEQFNRMRQSIGANTRISYELAEALTEGFNRVKGERDALAAHVERLCRSLQRIDADLEIRNFLESSSPRITARSALKAKPDTSLACLIAEHVDAAIGHAESLIEAGATPEEAFADVRRQAEGEGQ